MASLLLLAIVAVLLPTEVLGLEAAIHEIEGARQESRPTSRPTDGLAEAPEGWTFSVNVAGAWTSEVDLDDAPGDISTTRGSLGLRASHIIDEKWRVSLGLSHESSRYDFGGGAVLGGITDPLDRAEITTVSVGVATQESENMRWSVRAFVRSGVEPGAAQDTALTTGIGGSVLVRTSERLELGGGLFAQTRLEDDPLLIPYFAMKWVPTKRIKVGSVGSKGGQGAGYVFSEHLNLFLAASFQDRQIRLDEGASLSRGSVRDTGIGIRAGVRWKASDSVTATLFVGGALRQIELRKRDSSVGSADVHPAPFLGFSMTFGL